MFDISKLKKYEKHGRLNLRYIRNFDFGLSFNLSCSDSGRGNIRRFWDTLCSVTPLLIPPRRNLTSVSQDRVHERARRVGHYGSLACIYRYDYIIG